MNVLGRSDTSMGPDACWPFMGARNASGYGRMGDGAGRVTGAHRLAYALAYGSVPAGMYVCHRCDNPPCCNPAHLFLGTAGDNKRDAKSKGRPIGGYRPAGPTAPTDWRTVLREQGRTLTWLAVATGRPRRTVYAYHQRRLAPTPEWLSKVSDALGVPVIETAA